MSTVPMGAAAAARSVPTQSLRKGARSTMPITTSGVIKDARTRMAFWAPSPAASRSCCEKRGKRVLATLLGMTCAREIKLKGTL
ncbi:hypothetical protein D3C86_1959610 [compost metagenome]